MSKVEKLVRYEIGLVQYDSGLVRYDSGLVRYGIGLVQYDIWLVRYDIGLVGTVVYSCFRWNTVLTVLTLHDKIVIYVGYVNGQSKMKKNPICIIIIWVNQQCESCGSNMNAFIAASDRGLSLVFWIPAILRYLHVYHPAWSSSFPLPPPHPYM